MVLGIVVLSPFLWILDLYHYLWQSKSFQIIVWTLYMWAGWLPNVIIIFGFVLDDIEKESPLTLQALKIVLCTTPLLLLLLVNTAKDSFDSDGNKELVAKLSVQIAIDLFDAVEMLNIILDYKGHKFNISKKHLDAMISVVCISFFLSPWQMGENKLCPLGAQDTLQDIFTS